MKSDGSLRVLKYPKLAVIKKIMETHPHSPPPTPPIWASTSVYYIHQRVWIIPIPTNEHEKLNIHKLYPSVNCTNTFILAQIFSKKLLRVRNSHFQNYGNEELNDPLENSFPLNWQNKKIPWNHNSDKFIVVLISKY